MGHRFWVPLQYVTYVYNLINYLLSGGSLGPAPARRLFLRGNFLIEKIRR